MRMIRRSMLVVAVVLLVFAAPPVTAAAPVTAAPATQPALVHLRGEALQFTRFIDQGAQGGRLETADITFENDTGVRVRLVAAIHIGEAAYFEALNQSFRQDDVVLYEMVKPKGALPPRPGQGTDSGVGQFQRFLKDTLALDYQLDVIDYTRPNFIHADLDTETFEAMQQQRGESFTTLMLQQLLDALTNPQARQADDPVDDLRTLVNLLARPDMETQLKLVIARQLGEMERVASGLSGPKGSVILTERNKAAFEVFEQQVRAGKKHMAIFYGAAHMPDLAERLISTGFKPIQTDWRLAWDLTIHTDRPSAIEKLLNGALDALEDPQ